VRCVGSSPTIVGCRFIDNAVPGGGGGAIAARYGSNPTVLDCEFVDNQAAWGGAVECRVESHPLFVASLFQSNLATPARGFGGGVFCDYTSSPAFERCTLIFNEAVSGGALALFSEASPSIDRCTLAANLAADSGGGLLCLDAAPTISRSIIAFHGGESVASFGTRNPQVTCTDIFGNTGGDWVGELAEQLGQDGNLHADPLFWSPPFDGPEDFNLQEGSPCAGDVSTCGLMGSRPVGPDTPTSNWPPHVLTAHTGWVSISWNLEEGTVPPAFRLLGRLDDQEWSVPFSFLGDGQYLAEDRSAVLQRGGRVVYSLYYRGDQEAWRLAWSVPIDLSTVPPRLRFESVYPNPFNPMTSIRVEVEATQRVRLAVCDLRGRELSLLLDEELAPGPHEISWNGTDRFGRALPAGTYLAIVQGDRGRDARKLTLVR
jgi:hypothetical protein